MADLDEMTPGEILADSSVAEFIKELGLGVAAAQAALDDNSVRQMEIFTARREDLGGRSLLDLGLAPAFYHYQHADITCSMQIRMEVGKSDEFGFGIRAGDTDTSRSGGTSSSDTTSSRSTDQRTSRTAALTMRSDSSGVLTIEDGTSLTPTGTTPLDRLESLQKQLADGGGDVDRLVFQPPDSRPDLSLEPPNDKILVRSPTVAFLRPDLGSAVIRIGDNVDTDFVVDGSVIVATTAEPDVERYAAHVALQFEAAGFNDVELALAGPRVELPGRVLYETGKHAIGAEGAQGLIRLAGVLVATGQVVGDRGVHRPAGGTSRQRPPR